MPVPVLVQLAGALAVLVGIYLTLPLGLALIVGGAVLVFLGTLAELVVRGRPVALPARRRRPRAGGAG